MCATLEKPVRPARPEPAALAPATPAAPPPAYQPVKTPPKPRKKKAITDDMLLDLEPLLASKLPDEVCPLCGFPRVETNMCTDAGDYMLWECDLCRGSVRRADQIRRRVIHPFLD